MLVGSPEMNCVRSFAVSAFKEMTEIVPPSENITMGTANLHGALAALAEGVPEESDTGMQFVGMLKQSPAVIASELDYEFGGIQGLTRGSRLWYDPRSVQLTDGVASDLSMFHHITPETMTDHVAAKREANAWTAKETENLLPPLFDGASINMPAVLILAAFMLAKTNWKLPFDEKLTEAKPFNVSASMQVSAQMMHMPKGKYNVFGEYNRGDRGSKIPVNAPTVVRLAGDNGLSLVAITPPKGMSLNEFIKNYFTLDNFSRWLSEIESQYSEKEIELYFPKFNSMSRFEDVTKLLARMGVTDLSNFSNFGIIGLPLDIIHQAALFVDEKGAKFAAQTGATFRSVPPTVNFDRPFIWSMINKNGTPLAMGRLVDPTKA